MEAKEKQSPPTIAGADFEKIVLKQSKKLFEPSVKWKAAATHHPAFNNKKRSSIYNTYDEDEMPNGRGKSGEGGKKKPFKSSHLLWWEPSQDNLAIEFCQETSTHGLKFLSQPKRHISERIFWVIAFIFGCAAAITLINDVWTRYKENPVIVTFQPKDQDIDSIPFPAVTFCNINKFPKTRIQELERLTRSGDAKIRKEAKTHLLYARSVCNAQQSFAEIFDFAASRNVYSVNENDTIDEDHQDEMLEFLLDNTIPCHQLIRKCIFAEVIYDCGDLFKPIVTDYGKCCTFNILPMPLLLLDPSPDDIQLPVDKPSSTAPVPAKEEIVLQNGTTKKRWNASEIELWKKWDYADGVTMPKDLKRPYRQLRAGMPYGLSILVDANTQEYYCPSSDSEGFRFILHAPLEMPHVMEYGSILELGKEVYVEINPEITNADDEVKEFKREHRQCYFGSEKQLKFFQPYTGANCIDECTAIVITKSCNCSFFYMPREDGTKICNDDERSADSKCIKGAKISLLGTLKEECGHCDNLCEDIQYHSQTSVSGLQPAKKLWHDVNREVPNNTVPKWADNRMSIVHIFFGSDTTVPKLRKRLYGDVDLIASTGGLLGLCLGVSVLSAIEAVYFFTIRAFWKYCKRRRDNRKMVKKFVEILKKKTMNKKPERVVELDPSSLPFYPANTPYRSFQPGYKNNGRGFDNQYGYKNETYNYN